MKKELSPAAIIAAVVGVLAAIGAAIFFTAKSDPALQGPHAAPRFNASEMEAAHARDRQRPAMPGMAGGMARSAAPATPGAR